MLRTLKDTFIPPERKYWKSEVFLRVLMGGAVFMGAVLLFMVVSLLLSIPDGGSVAVLIILVAIGFYIVGSIVAQIGGV